GESPGSVKPVPPAFVFTLDGVLVDSEAVKLQSFAEACGDVWRLSADELQTIQAYNARQRGIPRRQKFEIVHRHLVMRGDNASATRKADTLRRVAQAVDAPLVFFGDAPSDQVAAVTAGVRFVPVNPNDHLRAHLSEWVADFLDVASVLRLASLPPDLELNAGRP